MASALGTDIIDLSTVGAYGSESDPRAYRFDGKLNVANRGLMEFIEMLKADERFLYVLLTLSQEKNIKTGRFPLIYADECVISHTNETEFNEFLGNKKSDISKACTWRPIPSVWRAIFAILSRLEEPKMSGLTLHS